jgi:hypothetical protein
MTRGEEELKTGKVTIHELVTKENDASHEAGKQSTTTTAALSRPGSSSTALEASVKRAMKCDPMPPRAAGVHTPEPETVPIASKDKHGARANATLLQERPPKDLSKVRFLVNQIEEKLPKEAPIRSSGLQSDFGLIKRLILLTVVSRILHSALGNNCLSPSQLTPPVELDSL